MSQTPGGTPGPMDKLEESESIRRQTAALERQAEAAERMAEAANMQTEAMNEIADSLERIFTTIDGLSGDLHDISIVLQETRRADAEEESARRTAEELSKEYYSKLQATAMTYPAISLIGSSSGMLTPPPKSINKKGKSSFMKTLKALKQVDEEQFEPGTHDPLEQRKK